MKRRKYLFERSLLLLEISLIIFQSGTVQAANNADAISFRISQVIMTLIALYFAMKSLLIYGSYQRIKRGIILFLISEILALISFIQYKDSIIVLEYKIILLMAYYFMIDYFRVKIPLYFERSLYNILMLIALYTFVFYFVIGILKINVPYSTIQYGSWIYKNYFNVFYSFSIIWPPRICGLFWEPGVYQIYINLALFLYITLNKKNKKQLVLLLVNILFIQSTIGYMIAIILVSVLLLQSDRIKSQDRYILLGVTAFAGTIMILSVFLYKRATTNFYGDSYAMRINDLVVGLRLFAEHPIFGNGFYNREPFLFASQYHVGNSNGLLTWMYTTGICGMIFALFPFVRKMFCKDLNKILKQGGFLAFVLLINIGEPIYNLSIMIMLLAREYSSLNNNRSYVGDKRTERKDICVQMDMR